MNNFQETDILNLCLEDDLFCALYQALRYFEKEWGTQKPEKLWIWALEARQKLHESKRPDLLLENLFSNMPSSDDALLVESLLMWMLINEDRSTEPTPLKKVLSSLLLTQKEKWQIVYEEFSKSEGVNENFGYEVKQCEYHSKQIPNSHKAFSLSKDVLSVPDLVSSTLATKNPKICQDVYIVLTNIDRQKEHIFEEEIKRLYNGMNEIESIAHEPRKVDTLIENMENKIFKDQAQSNDVHIKGEIQLPESEAKKLIEQKRNGNH